MRAGSQHGCAPDPGTCAAVLRRPQSGSCIGRDGDPSTAWGWGGDYRVFFVYRAFIGGTFAPSTFRESLLGQETGSEEGDEWLGRRALHYSCAASDHSFG